MKPERYVYDAMETIRVISIRVTKAKLSISAEGQLFLWGSRKTRTILTWTDSRYNKAFDILTERPFCIMEK